MTDVENHTLSLLHQIDTKVDRVGERLDDLTARVGSLEDQMVSLRGTSRGCAPTSFASNTGWTASTIARNGSSAVSI